MPSTTELTENFIESHPSIKDCLKNEVINYSKLSRKISKELGIQKKSSIEAILVACRRYSFKLKKTKVLEEKIMNILKKSELEIKNKIIVVVIDKKIYADYLIEIEKKVRKTADTFYAIEGVNVFTVIASEKYLEDFNKLFKKNIINVSKNLALITLKSPESMENTPGVVSFLFSVFAENNVNIVETMSCWTDTIFVVSEKDVSPAMNFLKF